MKLSKQALEDFRNSHKPLIDYTGKHYWLAHEYHNWLNEEVECPHNRWEEDFEYNCSSRNVPTRCIYCKSRYNSGKITRYKLYEVEE